ncbi:MAG: DUF5677 domain-containing protein [Bacteroidota bacterium]
MNNLQNILKKELDLVVPGMVADLISSKLAAKGITITKKEKQHLIKIISEKQEYNIIYQKWKLWENKNINIDITEEDIKSIEGKAEKFIQKMPELIESTLENITDHMTTVLKKRWPKEKHEQQIIKNKFESDLVNIWKHPIDLLGMILTIATELGSNINDEFRTDEDKSNTLAEVLTRLNARGCQVGGEILRLISSGYADGAMARWRTLHEISVVASFIQEHGEETAKRYLQHSAVDSYYAALNYEKHCERLGYLPFDISELNKLKTDINDLKTLYGVEYASEYGWAADVLKNPSPRFADIERSIGVDHMRPYYKLASYNVHANPKGVLFKLGLLPETQLLLAGPSDFGLADPGQNAAASLCLLSSTIILLRPTIDMILSVKVMERLAEEAAETFVDIQKQMEGNGNE